MRYYRIQFLDEKSTPGFMEATDDGNFVRLTDLDGKDIKKLPHPSYRTLDDVEAEKPSWGL